MSKEPITLSTEAREQVNVELCQAAIDSRDAESPPRLPRLKRPPEARPLFDEQPTKLSPSAYRPETIHAFCAQGAK
jgi:hypothetical protein